MILHEFGIWILLAIQHNIAKNSLLIGVMQFIT